eukprot:177121_1
MARLLTLIYSTLSTIITIQSIIANAQSTCDNQFPEIKLQQTDKYDALDKYNDPNEMNTCIFSAEQVGVTTKLSNNFMVSEFLCNDGSDGFRLSPALIQCVQSVRDDLGSSIVVNSGYRTVNYNQQIGGATNSFHMSGTGADISTSSVGILQFADIVICNCANLFKSEGYDIGLGLDDSYIHIDMRQEFGYWVYDDSPLSKEEWKDYIETVSDTCNGCVLDKCVHVLCVVLFFVVAFLN